MTPTYCIVVPHFNHSEQFSRFLPELSAAGLPLIVVDDGSDSDHLQKIEQLLAGVPNSTLLRNPVNTGKGTAVIRGARWAAEAGYTHMLQIDADGQHAADSISDLVAESQACPAALVSGLPVFGADVPPSRLHGRKISLWWSRIETLSGEIKDAMCGFRIYPLESFLKVCDRQNIGPRMQFDNDAMVRLYWLGVRIRYVPVVVCYPVDGRSHFELLGDNVRISLMHTKLVLGMLWRSPWLLIRNVSRAFK